MIGSANRTVYFSNNGGGGGERGEERDFVCFIENK